MLEWCSYGVMYIIGFDDSIYIDLIIFIAFYIAPVDPLPVGKTMY